MEAFSSTEVGTLTAMPSKLAGLAEVAEMLGVTKRTATKYTRRPDFPPPLDRIAAGPVWSRAAVEKWAHAHLPLSTGRPPKTR
jgi:predicted DNA-binding transcriptional regulator AlpA